MVHLQKETQFPPAGIDSARLNAVSPIVCWAFYLYVFSIPFEIPNRSIPLEVPTVVGCLFLLVTLLRSRECFCWPPAAFWCFLVYLCMYVIVSLWHGEEAHQEEVIKLFFSLFQLMFLFWTAYTLTRHEKVSRAVLLTLVVSCAVRSVLQLSGIATTSFEAASGDERFSALGQNANNIARILSVGLVALIGLAYGLERSLLSARILVWPLTALLGITIVQTGSRGGLLALGTGLLAFMLGQGTIRVRLRNGLMVLLAIGFFIFASYQTESTRHRFEKTFESRNLAGRERIFPETWQMFLEKPLIGWGPIHNKYELGSRLREPYKWRRRDTHNLLLEVMTATGLLGAAPFFVGVSLWVRAAWKARSGVQGILPFAMTVAVLTSNMSGNWIVGKLDWLVLAYALASGRHFVGIGWRHALARPPDLPPQPLSAASGP